ncbi:MAG: methyltransferase domain-containing protein [Nitrospirae bacterium]|nr:methyltransferase domain-containing protein [Nitrospirota bacterium]
MNSGINELYMSRDRHYELKEVKAKAIDLDNRNSVHARIVDSIATDSIVLDVGCSYGYLGEWLVKNRQCKVYGIEIDEIAIDKVRSEAFYNDVFAVDLDFFERNAREFKRFCDLDIQFDYIICADVLEHLKDPTTALVTLLDKLKESGKVLVSIPNVANIDVTLNIIEGKFNYSRVGILDSTHLRFFTRTSFSEWVQSINSNLLKDHRLEAELIGSTETMSEFAAYVKSTYPNTYNLLAEAIGEDATVLQYVFLLTKKKRGAAEEADDVLSGPDSGHIKRIEERLHELHWSLECAGRIFKKKHEANSKHMRKLLSTERRVASLESQLSKKEAVLAELLKHSYRITPMDIRNRPPAIKERISVIVPVKNGGEQLRTLLEKIRSQRRVEDVEIIVIDSESTDDSVSIARAFKSKVISIPQSEFNHGATRNLGAAEASGEFLVFTVQDAVPINSYWLYNMICPFIEIPELAALTSKQFVNPEADLFSLWMSESLADVLDFKKDSIYSLTDTFDCFDWKLLDSRTKRRVTFFDNVSSCVRRRVLNEFQFSPIINAEDIDFGVKLLSNKKTLGYLTSTGVLHWHERGPEYVFKRYYVGTKASIYILNNDLSYFFDSNNITWEALLANITDTYDLINASMPPLSEIQGQPVKAIRAFVNALQRNIDRPGRFASKARGDEGLDMLIAEIKGDGVTASEPEHDFSRSFLIHDFMKEFQRFTDYLCRNHNTLDGREEDFVSCIYKIFATTAGEAVGAYFLEAETLNRLTPDLKRIDRMLGKGVCYF